MTNVVMVEIAGQRYPVRSALDPAYVAELAAHVDAKIRAASDAAPTSDMLGLAILAALNIADEFHRIRERQSDASGDFNARALRLEQLVDEALSIC